MNLREEIYTAYRRHIEENPEKNRAGALALKELLEHSPLSWKGVVEKTLQIPKVFDEDTIARFREIAGTAYRIFGKVADGYRRSSAYRKVASEVMAFAGFAEKIPSMIMTADRSELCLAVMPRLKEALDKAEDEIVDAIEELTKFIFFDEKMPNYIALRLDGHFEN